MISLLDSWELLAFECRKRGIIKAASKSKSNTGKSFESFIRIQSVAANVPVVTVCRYVDDDVVIIPAYTDRM